MDEDVWEIGYPLVIDKRRQGLLQDIWRHCDKAPAEMFFSGHRLLELHNDIMAVTPTCGGKPPMLRFLNDLGKMCLRAHSEGSGLQVVAGQV